MTGAGSLSAGAPDGRPLGNALVCDARHAGPYYPTRIVLGLGGVDAKAGASEIVRRFTARCFTAGERGEVDGKLAAQIVLSRA